ncbi:MAG: hypothetical protein A3J93_03595 [Candidatus Magasanikbacteria bacterium RIFOXYC2_FULL_42_28]|uniref:Uncharacterized protein n=1 Tax=Candidatus Magasanikbacteria bacterium RIFOXYC2_FULL_42_28 TaxID=1798704 RepID=A0A1F6NUN9_9BACT|nr:MAG: hypothetical protein A3J93_03595 [Candidatus Magasanikbacteria bacterium RIFOXYC2_FULL_42_28]
MAEFKRFTPEEMKIANSRAESVDHLINGKEVRRGGHGGSWPGEKVGGGAEYVRDDGVEKPRLHVTEDQLESARFNMAVAKVEKDYVFPDDNARAMFMKESGGEKLNQREIDYLVKLKELGDEYNRLKVLRKNKEMSTPAYSDKTFELNKQWMALRDNFDEDEHPTPDKGRDHGAQAR